MIKSAPGGGRGEEEVIVAEKGEKMQWAMAKEEKGREQVSE